MNKNKFLKEAQINEKLDNILFNFMINHNLTKEQLIKYLKGFMEFETKQI